MEESLRIEDPRLSGKGRRPYIVAGPCSAESESQVLETARGLAGADVQLFRAGVWKPRTRPDSFEGAGEAALPWLRRVREETGLPVTAEVATARHVELVLEYGLDAVWIGARTTANPFAVQEIADALRGTDMPVWVKNPVNPDVELWIGAFERLNKAGVTRLGGIHRGFSLFDASGYRNAPCWQIPIELRRRIPSLTLLADPSHLCGRSDLVMQLAQYAMNLGFDGLMVETHCRPCSALSDAAQQLTPDALRSILTRLQVRGVRTAGGDEAALRVLRDDIDRIDDRLLDLLAQRMDISDQIGRFKKARNIPILQTGRWNELLQRMCASGQARGLDASFVSRIFDAIHVASIERQQQVMQQPDRTSDLNVQSIRR